MPDNKIPIGISGARPDTPSVAAMMRQVADEGGEPVFLAPSNTIEADLARVRALVLMGNDFDIDPAHYLHRYPKNHAKSRLHPATQSETADETARARADYEWAILAAAVARKMPVLGICGGMQRINIHCGGTLHQHIPDLVGCDRHMQHKQGVAPHLPSVPVIIKQGTLLADIACGLTMPFVQGTVPHCALVIMENSMHHQSVDKIGEHLCASALTDTIRLKDGTSTYLVEAVEAAPGGAYAGQFLLGVQWHPEFGASSLGSRIVQRLLAASLEFTAT